MTTIEMFAEKLDMLTAENEKLKKQLKGALTPMVPVQPSQVAQDINRQAMESEYRDMITLLRHIWTHSNYKFCGYWQMTTEQKEMFRVITGTSEKVFEVVKDHEAFQDSVEQAIG